MSQAQPDGYTLLVGNISTNSINPFFSRPHESERAEGSRADHQARRDTELHTGQSEDAGGHAQGSARVCRNPGPGQLNFQAPLGSYSHLDMLALTAAAGVKMVHLPSKGAGETLPALLRGDIHITESNVASNIGSVKAGQIKAYAVTAEQRLAEVPEVPTMAEAGFPASAASTGTGFLPGTNTRARSSRSFMRRVWHDEGARCRWPLAKRLSRESQQDTGRVQRVRAGGGEKWEKIIRDNNVKID